MFRAILAHPQKAALGILRTYCQLAAIRVGVELVLLQFYFNPGSSQMTTRTQYTKCRLILNK
jgi:hypothetical protein